VVDDARFNSYIILPGAGGPSFNSVILKCLRTLSPCCQKWQVGTIMWLGDCTIPGQWVHYGKKQKG